MRRATAENPIARGLRETIDRSERPIGFDVDYETELSKGSVSMTKTEEQTESAGGTLVRSGKPPVRTIAERDVPEEGEPTVGRLLQLALEKGTNVEQLERLIALHERVSNRNAAIEFAEAMAKFQADCPPITHSKKAKITTSSGGGYEYTYAELDAIARAVNPILARHGLSYSWDTSINEKGWLHCTCTVRHINGHVAPPANFSLPTDSNNPGMSAQQKVASATTFAKRQSLIAALGITTSDDDYDGGGASVDPRPISAKQLQEIEELVTDAQPDLPKFLAHLGVEDLKQLPASRYREAVSFLRQKVEQDKKKKAGTR